MARFKIKNVFLSLKAVGPLEGSSREHQENEIRSIICDQFGWSDDEMKSLKILRRSLDARGSKRPVYCYTVEIETTNEAKNPKDKNLEEISDPSKPTPTTKRKPCPQTPPVIVGSGPAGLFAAWALAHSGLKPLLIERGPEVKKRSKLWFNFLKGDSFNPEANLLFGEGGAGAYSDGKLTTRIKDPRVKDVLQVFVECGAPEDTLYDAKPHIGSNFLPAVVRNMRQKIIERGGIFQFDCRLESLTAKETIAAQKQTLKSIQTSAGEIPAEFLVLAIGHSARDSYRWLFKQGLQMTAKPFQMGVRIEHPQELINASQYGTFCSDPNLPPAEYRLVAKEVLKGKELYSFCMCPGGEILPATEKEGFLCVNGASKRSRKGPFANSGLVITIDPEQFDDDPLKGIAFQEKYERLAFESAKGDFAAPAQKVEDFLKRRESRTLLETSYPLAINSVDLNDILPDFVVTALHKGLPALEKKIRGFTGPQGMIVGPESRSCSPIRMNRDPETLESINYSGIFPVGEGAGYAGGIMSAAVDGLRAAEAILARL